MASPKLKSLLVLCLLVIGLSFQGWRLFPGIWIDLSQVLHSIGQPGLWRGANFGQGQRFANYVRFLHENIPPGARVILPPAGFGPEALSTTPFMQFFLAPRQVINCTNGSCLRSISPGSSYFLVVGRFPLNYPQAPTGNVRMFDAAWGVVAPQDARPGDAVDFEGFQNLLGVFQAALIPVLWLSLLAAAGGLLIAALGLNWSLSFKLALGYGIGLGAFSLAMAIANLLGLPINRALVLGTSAFLFLAALGLLIWIRRRAGWQAVVPVIRLREWSRQDPWPLIFLVLGGLAGIIAAGKGYHSADEVQIWGVKGAGIALTQSLSTVTQWGTNTLPYPLNLPILIAAARLLFGELLPASKLIFSGFYLCLALVSYHFLVQAKVSRLVAGLATLILATTPIFFRHAGIGFANLPLAYYLVGGVLLLVLAFENPDGRARAGRILLSGLCFMGAAWTRPEGMVMALAAMALLWAIALLTGCRALSFREALFLALPLGLYAVLWQLIGLAAYSQAAAKSGLAGAALAGFLGGNLHLPETGYILRRFFADLFDPGIWGGVGAGLLLISAGLLLAIILRRRVERASLMVLACGLLLALIVVGMYIITSYDTVHDVSWWVNSGLDRMALPAITLLWIGAASLLKFPDRRQAGQLMGADQEGERTALTPQYTRRFLRLAAPILILLGFIAFMSFFFPFRNRFQFDEDEGINLIKADLVAKGYSLYEQIWSDQPPLLTYALVVVFSLFGTEANLARALILALAAVLLLACYLILRRTWGGWHALAGTFLIVILPTFMRLSVSVMVGLPSITFAMLSLLAVILWHQQRKPIWLILSALAFSASVLIKLFTGYLVPVIVVGLLVGEYMRLEGKLRGREMLWPAGIWAGVFAAVTAGAILFWVGPANLGQLYQSHLLGEWMAQDETTTINFQLRSALPVLALALFGILFTILDKKWLSLYLIAWMGSAYLLLSLHSPVWYHHALLVTIPAAMLGGVAVGEAGLRLLEARQSSQVFQGRILLSALALVTLGWALYKLVPAILPELRIGANRTDTPLRSDLYEDLLSQVERYAGLSRRMITDVPMFPFRYGLEVPPNLAVFSLKRFDTGLITQEEILQAIEAYSPEQILLKKEIPGLEAYLRDHYRLVYTRGKLDLYIRDDLNLEGRYDP